MIKECSLHGVLFDVAAVDPRTLSRWWDRFHVHSADAGPISEDLEPPKQSFHSMAPEMALIKRYAKFNFGFIFNFCSEEFQAKRHIIRG